MTRFLVALSCFMLAACSNESGSGPTFYAGENPEHLSAWGMLTAKDGALHLGDGVTPYDLATPLFSDYALKLRTVWTPEGAPALYDPHQAFEFPIGTVVTKTFYYPQENPEWDGAVAIGEAPQLADSALPLAGYRLIETRILVRRQDGWTALPYVWNEAQTDAVLKRAGEVKRLTLVRDEERAEDFAYLVPNANQCAGCHATNATTRAIQPIGLKARHLNKRSTYRPSSHQLEDWIARGLLDGEFGNAALIPQNAIWTDEGEPLEARARAYLDVNCSHCHNPDGAADTSGLNLEPDAAGPALGLCKTPVAAGGGTGGRPFDIFPGDPDRSITIFRMETTNPGAMMPELGRAVTHEEGVALIAAWIADMERGCS